MNGTKTEIAPGVWRVRVDVGRNAKGNPIERSKTVARADSGEGQAQAGSRDPSRRRRAREDDRPGEPRNASTGTETFGMVLDRFLDHAESLGRSPTTVREYRRIAETVVRPELGKVRLDRLTALDLDRLYARLTAKGNKATTVRRVHALIGAALHQAQRWQLVDRNVSRQATPPPVRAAEITAPEPDEVRRIIEAAEAVEPTLAVAATARRADRRTARGTLLAEMDGPGRRGGDASHRSLGLRDRGRRMAREVHQDTRRAPRRARRSRARDPPSSPRGRRQARRRAGRDYRGRRVHLHAPPAGLEPIRPDVLTKFTRRLPRRRVSSPTSTCSGISRRRRRSPLGSTR